jgi:hypothetical protein
MTLDQGNSNTAYTCVQHLGVGKNSIQLPLKQNERYIKHSDIPLFRFDVSNSRNAMEINLRVKLI